MVKDPEGKSSLSCPVCGKPTPVPEGGVAHLQPGMWGKRPLPGKVDELPKDGGVEGSSESSGGTENRIYCLEHVEEVTELYCETCGVLVCYKCIVEGAKHHSHEYNTIKVAFERYKVEMAAAIAPMEKQLEKVKQALVKTDTSSADITSQQGTVESQIRDSMSEIRRILDVRKAELLDQLNEIADRKMKALEAQKREVASTHAQLSGALAFIRENNTDAEGGGRLVLRTNTPLDPESLMPTTEANITFEASSDVVEACQKFGEVSIAGTRRGRHADGRSARAKCGHQACTCVCLFI